MSRGFRGKLLSTPQHTIARYADDRVASCRYTARTAYPADFFVNGKEISKPFQRGFHAALFLSFNLINQCERRLLRRSLEAASYAVSPSSAKGSAQSSIT
jgi:hypothetical protein